MNLSTAGLARYGAVKITTCSPGQLLVMLYDGLFRFLRGASVAMGAKDRRKAGERIGRALAILEQLLGGLNRDHAPALCDHLASLYTYCIGQVTTANLRQTPELIDQVVVILTPLRDAWAVAAAKVAADAASLQAASTGSTG